ncbi:hypothetical protein E4631_24720 [Hymenobacter sp. UV11]|uniref:hypothetical protein n=1 Tax=Hymenobacter sp. UV11 TaxID=1849735 RepID=UPI00105E4B86|nr:hypothetical protein [Hymenobacter sp. UV11]TFZ62673.1 hypothetical protein E4631_24720 [Hymenobacter sp. UV11]
MKSPFPAAVLPATTVALKPLCLADLTAKQRAGLPLTQPANLSVDCWGLLAPPPQGVCRSVA